MLAVDPVKHACTVLVIVPVLLLACDLPVPRLIMRMRFVVPCAGRYELTRGSSSIIRLLGRQVAVRFVRDANINLQAFDMWQAAFVNYPDTPWRRSAVAYLQARCLAVLVGI